MCKSILVKSIDRISGTSSEFTFKSNRIMQGTYTVKFLTIPNTIYNVTDNNNIILVNTMQTTVPVGHYTSATITAALKVALESVVASVFVVTFNKTTGKITISSTDVFTLSFPNNFNNLIGFPATVSSVTTYTSDKIVKLSKPSLGITIQQASDPIENASNDATISTLYVPLINVFGEYTTITNLDLKQTVEIADRTRLLNIKITDNETNETLDLNGSEWEMLLCRCMAQ